MFTKKSLVLLGEKNDNKKAVLTVENDGELISGRLRLYNFGSEPSGILSLGIYSNKKVIKCGLVHISTMLYSFKTKPELGDEFSCAVINIAGGAAQPILFGSTDDKRDVERVLEELSGDILDTKSAEEAKDALDQSGVEYDDDLQNEIDSAVDSEFAKIEAENKSKTVEVQTSQQFDKCENCRYKKCFFEASEPQEQQPKFFEEISSQIGRLFEDSPHEEYLENAIPSSKWVRVEFGSDGDYYILGLINDDGGTAKYVCYGVPGIYQKQPPKNLSGFPVWFPLDSSHPDSFGYWLTYQDAESGESVKAIVE